MPAAGSDPAQPDPKEARRAQIRQAVARHKEKMDSLTRLEQLALRLKESLGENYDPYTPEERRVAERLSRSLDELAAEAEAFHDSLVGRLRREGEENPALLTLAEGLSLARGRRVTLEPF